MGLEIGVAIYRDERGGFQTSFADTRSPRKHVVANGRTTLIEGSASGPSVLLSGPGSGIGTFPQFIQAECANFVTGFCRIADVCIDRPKREQIGRAHV